MSSFGPMPKPRGPANRQMFYARGAKIMGWIIIGIIALGFLDSARRGAWDFIGQAGPWFALVVWGIVVLWIRPAVAVDDEGVEIFNVLRRWQIPWGALVRLSHRQMLTLYVKDGRGIQCWSAPVSGSARRSARRDGSGEPDSDLIAVDATLELRWEKITGGADAVEPPPQALGAETHARLDANSVGDDAASGAGKRRRRPEPVVYPQGTYPPVTNRWDWPYIAAGAVIVIAIAISLLVR